MSDCQILPFILIPHLLLQQQVANFSPLKPQIKEAPIEKMLDKIFFIKLNTMFNL